MTKVSDVTLGCMRGVVAVSAHSIRNERMLVKQLDYNLLFRWFVGLSMDDRVWNHPVFSKNRERLTY